MNQVVKDKMAREIMVVPVSALFSWFSRESRFYGSSEYDFKEVIINNYEYMLRWEAEENESFKQPLPYGAIVNDNNDIFVYKRWGTGSNAWESRLHEKISFWVWWHIELEDENSVEILEDALVREVEEEIDINNEQVKSVSLVWYINDDSNDVGKVHFGVFYVVKVHTSNFDLLDGELDNGEFVSIQQLENMIASDQYDLETWSEIAFPALKNMLK